MPTYKLKTSVTGGKDKTLLYGAEIHPTDDGKNYELRIVAARTSGNSLPTGAFTFPQFDFADYTWTIAVTAQTTEQMTGTWANTDPQITEAENGDFTAQAGQGADEDKDASAASA